MIHVRRPPMGPLYSLETLFRSSSHHRSGPFAVGLTCAPMNTVIAPVAPARNPLKDAMPTFNWKLVQLYSSAGLTLSTPDILF